MKAVQLPHLLLVCVSLIAACGANTALAGGLCDGLAVLLPSQIPEEPEEPGEPDNPEFVIGWLPEPAAVLGTAPTVYMQPGQTTTSVTFAIASDDDKWWNRLDDLDQGTEPDYGWTGMCWGEFCTGQANYEGRSVTGYFSIIDPLVPLTANVDWSNANTDHHGFNCSDGDDGELSQAATIIMMPGPPGE